MTSLSDDNQADIIEAFNSTSRYLDDIFNIRFDFRGNIVNAIKHNFTAHQKQL